MKGDVLLRVENLVKQFDVRLGALLARPARAFTPWVKLVLTFSRARL